MTAASLTISSGGSAGRPRSGTLSASPLHRRIGNVQRVENLLVEVFFAIEQRLQCAEEHAGFRALNDAVIVGAGHRHDFADAERCDGLGRNAAIFGGIIHRADCDDCALSGHKPRHGCHGADGAGIRQRDGGALKIRHGEFAGAGARDEIVKRGHVLRRTTWRRHF